LVRHSPTERDELVEALTELAVEGSDDGRRETLESSASIAQHVIYSGRRAGVSLALVTDRLRHVLLATRGARGYFQFNLEGVLADLECP
jgi:hypothetical protein